LAAAAQGLIGAQETVVVINTGSGLKDIGAVMAVTGAPTVIRPELDAVREALAGRVGLG
jgi:threonine synthase